MARFKPDFTHVHVSGLWDSKRWAAVMAAAMTARASVITVTEFTQSPWRPKDPWKIWHPTGAGRNECAIVWNSDVWDDPQERYALPISTTPYALGSGKIRPRVHLVGISLRHRATGKRVNFAVFHAPSAIEGRNALVRGARRAKAALECFAAIGRHRKAELRGEPSVLAADWNLDLAKAWVKALLRARLKGWRNAWKRTPKRGSHGRRLIDGVRFTRQLRTKGSRLGRRVGDFDHTMVITTFAFA